LRSLNAKGGERKRLTVLFADIRNSTGLIDSLGDPELGMKRLQPVLDLMHEAVVRYDGVVNKSQGDGVMALFGAPQPHEDHAVRGCLAALAMQDGVSHFGDSELQIRVGVHTGEVVVQAIEHGMYQTYDAAGANVHLANRLEQLAEPGSILVRRKPIRPPGNSSKSSPSARRPFAGSPRRSRYSSSGGCSTLPPAACFAAASG
jgi:adenylate cyclase